MSLFLRLYVEAPDESAARQLLHEGIGPALERDVRVQDVAVEPYWKIQGWFGVLLRLDPLGEAAAAFDRITGYGESGWLLTGTTDSRDAVWNSSGDTKLFIPEVRWAHLEL